MGKDPVPDYSSAFSSNLASNIEGYFWSFLSQSCLGGDSTKFLTGPPAQAPVPCRRRCEGGCGRAGRRARGGERHPGCCTSGWVRESLIRVAWPCRSRATPHPGQPLAHAGWREPCLLVAVCSAEVPDGCGWVESAASGAGYRPRSEGSRPNAAAPSRGLQAPVYSPPCKPVSLPITRAIGWR